MTYRKFISLFAVVASTTSAYADESEQIIVTANRAETPVSKVGLSVSVITADDIARLQTPGVTELLRTVPGLATTRSGGIGTLSSVFIRGASSDHTVALIDGVKINDPSSTAGGFDFGRLMAGNIERIEVVRGPQSVLWGSQAIGGVVNVITRKAASDELAAGLQGEYGYRNTADIVANAAVKAGPLSLSGGGSFLRTGGISAFSEARGGKEKDGTKEYGANLNLGAEITDTLSLDLRGWYSHSRTEIDGYANTPPYGFADAPNYNRTREAIGYAGLDWNSLGGRWKNRIGYSLTDTDRRDYNPTLTPQRRSLFQGRNERLEYQGLFELERGWDAVFGAEREWSRSTFVSTATRSIDRARLTSFYGQLSATPLAGLTINAGARHDRHSDFGGHTTFAANAAYTPNAGDTVIRASYGEGFKAPSLYQLHSSFGNPALRPESAKSWEIGLAQRALDGRAQIGVSWFTRKTRNLVNFVSCVAPGNPSALCDYPGGFSPFAFDGYYENIDRARARGVEMEIKLRPIDRLEVDLSYSHVVSKDRVTGFDLLRRPRDKAYASVDYRWPFGLTTGASVMMVSDSADIDDFGGRVQNDGFAIADIRASYPIGAHVELYARIENLFDTTYETVYNYGQPGRAAYAGVRLKI